VAGAGIVQCLRPRLKAVEEPLSVSARWMAVIPCSAKNAADLSQKSAAVAPFSFSSGSV
jgi:hypothetical protein